MQYKEERIMCDKKNHPLIEIYTFDIGWKFVGVLNVEQLLLILILIIEHFLEEL